MAAGAPQLLLLFAAHRRRVATVTDTELRGRLIREGRILLPARMMKEIFGQDWKIVLFRELNINMDRESFLMAVEQVIDYFVRTEIPYPPQM